MILKNSSIYICFICRAEYVNVTDNRSPGLPYALDLAGISQALGRLGMLRLAGQSKLTRAGCGGREDSPRGPLSYV